MPNTGAANSSEYRIFYTIDDEAHIVAILTIEARKDAYR